MTPRRINLSALALSALALCACDDETKKNDTQDISIATKVVTSSSGEEQFADGDSISVYAWMGNNDVAPAVADRMVDNSINVLTNGRWVATPQMLWEERVKKYFFIGVYPSIERDKGLDDDLTQYAYKLNTDNQTASDLLVAVNTTGQTAADGDVALQFTHVMAKVIVNLTFRNQWGTDDNGENVRPIVSSVTICDAADEATVNLLTKSVRARENDVRDIVIPEVSANTTYSSIFIPQSGVRQVKVVIDGVDYTFNNAEDIRLESGKITTISLIVGTDAIDMSNKGVTISPWESGTTIDGGEAQR